MQFEVGNHIPPVSPYGSRSYAGTEMPTRRAETTWQGGTDGSGDFETDSGQVSGTFRFPTRYISLLLVATGAMAGVLTVLSDYAPQSEPQSTVILILSGALVYFAVILAVPEVRRMVWSSFIS